MKSIDLEKLNAKLFILFLPFRMPNGVRIVTQFIGMPAEFFCFIFHLVGLFFMVLYGSKNEEHSNFKHYKLISTFGWMMVYFVFVAILMSTYVYFEYGFYNGNSPYIGTIKLLVDFMQYLLIIIYCRRIFLILGVRSVYQWLTISFRVIATIGYLQIAKIYNFPIFSQISDFVSTLFSLRTFNNQIALTLYEPSWAAIYIGVIVLPMLLSRFFVGEKSVLSSVIEMLLWIPIIIMTKSTTCYLLTFAAFSVAIIFLLFNRKVGLGIKICVALLFICGVLIVNTNLVDKVFGFDFSYLLRNKLFDNDNQSTVMRKLPLIGDWEIFKHFPIFGCGNGLQGYFYPLMIPTEYYKTALDSNGRAIIYGSATTIPNGQLFFPGILSGYGLIGIVLFVRYLLGNITYLKDNFSKFGQFGYIYTLSLLPIFFAGMKSEFVGFYIIWFVLSIPYAAYDCEKINENEEYERKVARVLYR